MAEDRVPDHLALELPGWLRSLWREAAARHWASDTERMQLVLDVTARNLREGGGPFGAAVFCEDSATLVSLGANRVVASRCSLWHAETVAIAAAHQRLGTLAMGEARYSLFTSCEPCCMCLGALLWSGVKRVVCAARDADARAAGFDEGPKPEDWVAACRQRGVEVQTDLMRSQAATLLRAYADAGGVLYNG